MSTSEGATETAALDRLRAEIRDLNLDLLDLLSRRARLVVEVQSIKSEAGIPTHLPEREQEMLDELARHNTGPFPDETVRQLFKEVLRASVSLMERQKERVLRVSREHRAGDLAVRVGDREIGRQPVLIAGPCAVETEEQMETVAAALARAGVWLMRGGAFKPRSSPYAFQGLGEPGLHLLHRAAQRHGLATITEVVDPRHVELICRYADVLQIGARNMQNYELLREVGRAGKPVMLKRGMSATIEGLVWAAEYIVAEGNERVIFCERGIRTFERETRNTLDVSSIALLRRKSFLPVIADVSHAAGRKDILAPLGLAALAAGAQGLMVEVHPCPAVARSDSQQQLDLPEFEAFMRETGFLGLSAAGATSHTSAV